MSKSTTSFKYPSLLSFKASIVPSIFAFYSFEDKAKEEEKFNFETSNIYSYITPIQVEKSVLRTTIANFGDGEKITASLKDKGGANIQTIEKATLQPNSDTLVIIGSVKFFNNSLEMEATNELSFKEAFKTYIDLYKEKIGYDVLAEKYFMNLINGQILWRNKYGEIETKISVKDGVSLILNSEDFNDMSNLSVDSISNADKKEKAKEIIKKISKAFSTSNYLLLNVISKIKLGLGQTVYPSQEFDEEKKISKVLAKSNYVYQGNTISQAVFHEQKVGNAIRTIDEWYKDDADYPIAIEPYGISQKELKAYRSSVNDFYSYFMKIDKLIAELENFDQENKEILNKHNYVIACLIRGGVYSGSSNKKGKEEVKEGEINE